ncbi:class I SAM-dependent methyltransferase [Actinokineospora iranica]|uniref:Phospholipid N-methyltransferase n=1 Tax=Actinokineospora iranica TaxID=1271860 RepID=A0A1G6S2J9_9PSEU|nr:methyltransferase domain-containing protein [Actinokineospora iranica]SDD11142.1 Phospholipid N-methyltransferase [Actinokineospora iranica]
MVFLLEFLRNPRRTGALVPSSPWSVRSLLDEADVAGARTVVELGAGTGAITDALLRRVVPDGRLLAMEVNPVFAARLRRRFDAGRVEVVCGSAARLGPALAERGLSAVDRVVSALPWTTMPDRQQEEILDAVTAALAEDGRFSTLMCRHRLASPGARRFLRLLNSRFGQVRRGSTVWAEFPPMFAYHCAAPARDRQG